MSMSEQMPLRPFAPGELSGVSLSIWDGPLKVKAGDSFRVKVSVANSSGVAIGAYRYWHPFPLFVGYVWTNRGTGVQLPLERHFTELWRPLFPGQHGTVHVRARAPQSPGNYLLTMVLWHANRWYDANSEVRPVHLEVEVCSSLRVLPHSINDYEDSIYSQNGEDGILRELFLRLGYHKPFSVEFGAGDGVEGNNTALWLRHYGWRGLMLEGNNEFVARIQDNYRGYGGVRASCEFLTADNIAGVFARNGVPREFDLLSIDVDGNDYWLWDALADYRPRVVVIEMNRIFKPPKLWVMAYNPEHAWNREGNRNYCGASLESLARLGKRLGYALLGTVDDINAFFVRADLLERSRFPELTAAEAFHPHERTWPPGWQSKCEGPFVEQ